MLRPSLITCGKAPLSALTNCRLQPSPQTIMASHASVLS